MSATYVCAGLAWAPPPLVPGIQWCHDARPINAELGEAPEEMVGSTGWQYKHASKPAHAASTGYPREIDLPLVASLKIGVTSALTFSPSR